MRVEGKIYSVWRARGPLWQRQIDASRAGCVAYVEQHHNSHVNRATSGALAIVDSAARRRTEAIVWGKIYTALCAAEYQQPDRGVVVYSGRGSYNVRFTSCPALLLEPLFVSNYEMADRARSGEGIDATARCLVESIRRCFPGGGLIGLSAGHAHRGGPSDPGAPVAEDDVYDKAFDDETELNEAVIQHAEEMLLEIEAPASEVSA